MSSWIDRLDLVSLSKMRYESIHPQNIQSLKRPHPREMQLHSRVLKTTVEAGCKWSGSTRSPNSCARVMRIYWTAAIVDWRKMSCSCQSPTSYKMPGRLAITSACTRYDPSQFHPQPTLRSIQTPFPHPRSSIWSKSPNLYCRRSHGSIEPEPRKKFGPSALQLLK